MTHCEDGRTSGVPTMERAFCYRPVETTRTVDQLTYHQWEEMLKWCNRNRVGCNAGGQTTYNIEVYTNEAYCDLVNALKRYFPGKEGHTYSTHPDEY